MQQVHWRIVAANPGEAGVLGLRMQDAQDPDSPWPYYFTGISAVDYPAVIEAAVQEIGSSGQYTGVNFPGDLDEWDIAERGAPLVPGTVALYQSHWGETIMPRATFYSMLEAFAERLLERTDRPAAWYEAMRAALAKLRIKMAADAASG